MMRARPPPYAHDDGHECIYCGIDVRREIPHQPDCPMARPATSGPEDALSCAQCGRRFGDGEYYAGVLACCLTCAIGQDEQ